MSKSHIQIRRTTKVPNEEPKVVVFMLPELSSKIIGPGVNNKLIYDLKRRGRSLVEYADGTTMEFEVL